MKILAAFFGLVLLFSPAVGCAQNDFGLYGNCPFPPHGVYIIERDNATIVKELEMQSQLAQAKLDLRMDETKIETLQHSYDMLSHLFDRMLNDRLNDSGLAARKPTAPASKPRAPVS